MKMPFNPSFFRVVVIMRMGSRFVRIPVPPVCGETLEAAPFHTLHFASSPSLVALTP